ncbi:hypothetical protein D9M69_587250 [compost metagenome]
MRLPRQLLECCRRINQASIEEHPFPGSSTSVFVILQRPRDDPAQKCGHVGPRQGMPAGLNFFLHDAPPRLFDNGMALPMELGKQRGFASTRTAGDDHKIIHIASSQRNELNVPAQRSCPHSI